MSSNPTLADVRARLATIAEERQIIAQRERTLAAEANELSIAARVLERMAVVGPDINRAIPPLPPLPPLPAASASDEEIAAEKLKTIWNDFKAENNISGKESTDDLILLCLTKASDAWHTSNDIQTWVSHLKGREVPMSTVSPTLSNLKSAGLVVRDGMKVALAARVAGTGSQRPELSLTS